MSKPIKSPSRATALLIKKAIRKNENNRLSHPFQPSNFRRKGAAKSVRI
jgi:hypothetical protein